MAAELVLTPVEGRFERILSWQFYCAIRPAYDALAELATALVQAAPGILAGVRKVLESARQAQFVLHGMPRSWSPSMQSVPVLSNRPRHRRRRR